MKKITLLIILLFAIDFSYGQSEVVISQYIETTSGSIPKGIEIFNVSGVDITFSGVNNLQISLGRNGAACNLLPGIDITSGTLLANEVWVIGTPNLTAYANNNGVNLSGTSDYGFDFNGNDALQLYLGGVLQDEFGTCGVGDPGTSWDGGGVSTRDNNLQLINGLCDGDIDGWTDPSSRFIQIADGLTMTGFGNAPTSCTDCASFATWDGSFWDNGTGPTPTIGAIINGNYNTSTNNINTCSLTVNFGYTLNIADGDHVQVLNNIIADGEITVQPQGAVVQINDGATVAENGIITVSKRTAPMNNWYEYTYWSSPVANTTIGSALQDADVNRRFRFDAQSFLDTCAETFNNNICSAGSRDDIDDNGDDWKQVLGTDLMVPGVGYASTHEESVFFGPGLPYQFRYEFEGPFNNGVITVPIYRNDSELNDYNWNLIGNPYPSAIDADLFLSANSNVATNVSGTDNTGTRYMDGAIFLWSQNTAPSSTANGSQQLNFSNDDFAIINAMGEIRGGDGVLPDRFIPSGQGFFVSMANPPVPATLVSGDIYTADVVFNNSMRVTNTSANSQFFKASNSKKVNSTNAYNKLWIDLTSDNGVFNQILVGYVNGATHADDGIGFDTHKYPTNGAALYTTIENSNKKFAIQGKAPSDLTENEIINLGFKTTIDVATLYSLSIDKLQGNFLNNNPVYLIDNLLNKTHDLKVCDYTFTSEVGAFNSRFQIVFSNKTLALNTIDSNENSLSIVELDNDFVNFKMKNNLPIKTVAIYDLLGRQLYNLKGTNGSETYQLSNLKNTVYIAKVELLNGAVITKKAIKR